MPNGGCLKCHAPIAQGLQPHYCPGCLAALGLKYDDASQKWLDQFQPVIRFYHKGEPYFEFTNFAPFRIELDAKVWPTSEHYFQAQKHAGSPLEEEIRRASGPREALKLGRSRPARSDWAKVKDIVMYRAVRAKFTQHPDLRALLQSTDDAELVEHTAKDDYWGDGGNGSGRNMLGCILMLVREELRVAEAEKGAAPGTGRMSAFRDASVPVAAGAGEITCSAERPPMIPTDVSLIAVALDQLCSARTDLKKLRVVRSQKVLPDFCEWLVAEIYGGERLKSRCHPGYDVVVGSEKIQVKHAAKAEDNPNRWSTINDPEKFDSLVFVILSTTYRVKEFYKIPSSELCQYLTGYRLNWDAIAKWRIIKDEIPNYQRLASLFM